MGVGGQREVNSHHDSVFTWSGNGLDIEDLPLPTVTTATGQHGEAFNAEDRSPPLVRVADTNSAPQASAAPTEPANNITETAEEKNLTATETAHLRTAFHFHHWQLMPKKPHFMKHKPGFSFLP